jgi:cation:H+ antiporter
MGIRSLFDSHSGTAACEGAVRPSPPHRHRSANWGNDPAKSDSSVEYLSLLIGLAGLWFGTELTIRGAVTVAERLGVSEFIVGVAILSIGSDLPELAIAVDGALKNLHAGDTADVIVGTALGSSLGQIGFVMGVAALFSFLTLPRSIVYRHGSVLLGSVVLLGVFGFDEHVSRTEGFALVTVYLIYLVALFGDRNKIQKRQDDVGTLSTLRVWSYLLVGLAIVGVSAELTVDGAIAVAAALDISEAFIAVIVIGLGTSLPELSISVGAAIRRRARMSVGNLIGSNVFDTLVPVGVAAAMAGLRFDPNLLRFEVPFLFVLSLVVLVFFVRIRGLQKGEAITILAMYGGYVLVKFTSAF